MLWPNGTKQRPQITSPYGWRVHPISRRRTFHPGTDFVGFRIVRAIADGVVRVGGTPGGWVGGGRQVWLQHDGFFTRNLHLSTVYVHPGQHVTEGQALGVMGATGAVTGTHLHIELAFGVLHYGNSGQLDIVPFIEAHMNQPSGGDPAPIDPEGDEEMRPRQIHAKFGDDRTYRALVIPGTGYFVKWTEGGNTYANGIATGFETGDSTALTQSLFEVFEREALAMRPRDALSIELAVA